MNEYTETLLIENPAIELFASLGWQTVNGYAEGDGPLQAVSGRETLTDVVLKNRLLPALQTLNPDLPPEALTAALEELSKDRSILNPVAANQEVYKLLKDGVKVTYRDEDGIEQTESVRVIDWDTPSNNDFCLFSQFWVTGDMYKRRADLVGFVNGLPLLFIELKASHKRLKNAFDENFKDYKTTIPQLFWYNAVVILSNGSESKIGSLTSYWEHFSDWKRINDEGEQGVISLDTMIRGTCEPARFLDLVENFVLFQETKGGTIKIVGKNHQYLGVNNALQSVRQIQENRGRLGVFWHTQGSGKSLSMVFFTLKILRKIPGNWSFLIVTDREDLDTQIYKNFAAVGAVTEDQIQAESGEHLKQLLQEDHRFVFTLIQKFRTEKGATYPKLSDRSDIIVITDEAHRSQYDTFAGNMRKALPNAAFIGFTGTPLIAGEELTKEVFGDYISIYNFQQSIEDNATVPLFYENRKPELQLTNENLNEDMENLLDEAMLDEEQEAKLEKLFAREYQIITRNDRLEEVAKDVVSHFMGRGFHGKAMMISIDKPTAVKMYDKVQHYWQTMLADLKLQLATCPPDQKEVLEAKIQFMEETDMAVIVSQEQNEVEKFREKGLDIKPHRERMVKEDLEEKFKDPNSKLRLVFVCAMWLTGFNAPSVSTLYLDKPMKNHTLMQTIARANRVFADKNNGLIVDYVGVFRNLQKALAIYAAPTGESDMPVKDKKALLLELEQAIAGLKDYCREIGFNVQAIMDASGFERVKAMDDAVELILKNDETKKKYLALQGHVQKLYKAILPDNMAEHFNPVRFLFKALADKIRSLAEPVDVSEVMNRVEALLDQSIAPEGFVIHDVPEQAILDLSQVDFEALQQHFNQGKRHTTFEQLKNAVEKKLAKMIEYNRTRMNYMEKFQQLIDEYNAETPNIQLLFDKLVAFAKDLEEEDKRGIKEQLSDEELVLFDILTKPEMDLSQKEINEVKKVARELLATLKKEKLVLDWRKRQQTRAEVRLTVERALDEGLPRVYSRDIYEKKCDIVYQHIYESYFGDGRSKYVS